MIRTLFCSQHELACISLGPRRNLASTLSTAGPCLWVDSRKADRALRAHVSTPKTLNRTSNGLHLPR